MKHILSSILAIAVLLAIEAGLICLSALIFKHQEDWEYKDAIFYTINLFTTVGYSRGLSCTSNGCIWAQMIVGMFGIMLTLCVLGYVVLELSRMLESDRIHKKDSVLWRILIGIIYMGIIFVLAILIPAGIVTGVADWSFLNALNFIFMTVTTVGYEDSKYTISDLMSEGDALYYCMLVYCFVGLALFLTGVKYFFTAVLLRGYYKITGETSL